MDPTGVTARRGRTTGSLLSWTKVWRDPPGLAAVSLCFVALWVLWGTGYGGNPLWLILLAIGSGGFALYRLLQRRG
jgi:hypothetical protein